MEKLNKNNSIHPFNDITNYLKALVIIYKTFCSRKKNYLQVQDCLKRHVQDIEIVQLETFINFIELYKQQYNHPFKFITDLNKFIIDIDRFCIERRQPSFIIETDIKMCLFCQIDNPYWYVLNTPKLFKDAALYRNEKIEIARINPKQCRSCLNIHYYSYAINNKTNKKIFYSNAYDKEFFHYTNETFFEKKLFETLLADLIFKQSSFSGFVEGYNYNNGKPHGYRTKLDEHRITQAFYCFEIIKFYKEHNIKQPIEIDKCSKESISAVDKQLRLMKPLILPNFIKRWSKHTHATKVKGECNFALVADGNWKLNRFKCIYTGPDTDHSTPEFEKVNLSCRLSPERDSYYCNKHSNFELKFNVDDFKISVNPATITKSRIGRTEVVIKAQDAYLTPDDEELILCTINLKENINNIIDTASDQLNIFKEVDQSKLNNGNEHSKQPKMPTNLKWLDRKDVPNKLYAELLDRRKPKINYGSCNTDKVACTSCESKCKTRGVMIISTNCGIVVSYREMFGAETLPQIIMLYLDTIDLYSEKVPQFMIYDDACHLHRFIENIIKKVSHQLDPDERTIAHTTPKLEAFEKKTFVVDKLHIQGHKEEICKAKYAPYLFKELKDINTVIVEQINFRVGRYKHILKHMNAERYNFYLYIIFNEMNRMHSEGRMHLYNQSLPDAHSGKRAYDLLLDLILQEEESFNFNQ